MQAAPGKPGRRQIMSYKDAGGSGGAPKQLPGANKEIKVDHEKLKDVAKAMQKDLDDLNSWTPGSLNDFYDGDVTWLTQDQLGNYPEGHGITQSAQAAYNSIGDTYGEFLKAYDSVIKAINKSADNHKNAEDANQHAAQQAGRDTQEY
jgi:uncharacterized protein YukE